jgi:hypothetical protein
MSSAKHGHALEDKAFKTPKPCMQCNESIWGFGSKHKRCTSREKKKKKKEKNTHSLCV